MINKIIDAISISLNDEFGDDYKIYTESIEQGFKEPCFFINMITSQNVKFLGTKYLKENLFCIQYFPKNDDTNEECMSVLEKMYSLAISDNSDIVVCRSYMVCSNNLEEMDKEVLNTDLYKRYILNRPSAHCKLVKKEILLYSELAFLENHHYEDIAEVPAFCLYAKNISFIDEYLYYYLVRE